MELTDFLLARIAEDEAAARACAKVYPTPWDVSDRGWVAYITADEPAFREIVRLEDQDSVDSWMGDAIEHIARWDPTRVLVECDAKRRIVEHHSVSRGSWGDACDGCQEECLYCMGAHTWPCPTLRLLVLPYADHPDCREEWKP